MANLVICPRIGYVALLAEGVDRNRPLIGRRCPLQQSPSSRRAWIEIGRCWQGHSEQHVALLAEGVDRNQSCQPRQLRRMPSPSSRRAWIEIAVVMASSSVAAVALLAEGVDRNVFDVPGAGAVEGRPPRGGRG